MRAKTVWTIRFAFLFCILEAGGRLGACDSWILQYDADDNGVLDQAEYAALVESHAVQSVREMEDRSELRRTVEVQSRMLKRESANSAAISVGGGLSGENGLELVGWKWGGEVPIVLMAPSREEEEKFQAKLDFQAVLLSSSSGILGIGEAWGGLLGKWDANHNGILDVTEKKAIREACKEEKAKAEEEATAISLSPSKYASLAAAWEIASRDVNEVRRMEDVRYDLTQDVDLIQMLALRHKEATVPATKTAATSPFETKTGEEVQEWQSPATRNETDPSKKSGSKGVSRLRSF